MIAKPQIGQHGDPDDKLEEISVKVIRQREKQIQEYDPNEKATTPNNLVRECVCFFTMHSENMKKVHFIRKCVLCFCYFVARVIARKDDKCSFYSNVCFCFFSRGIRNNENHTFHQNRSHFW